MKSTLKKILLPVALALGVGSLATVTAQVYPLSENTWSNPEFVKRFMGSYGFNTELNPSITSEEKTLFEAIVPLIQSNPTAAIAQVKAALKPESSAAVDYTLANLYFQQQQVAEAKAAYMESIKKFPNFMRAYKNLGIIYIQEGNFEEARKMLLKHIELGGGGSDSYGLLAYCYLNQGMNSAALNAYDMALLFDPKSRDWRMGKVQTLMNMGQSGPAIPMIDELLKEFPTMTDLLLIQANAFVAEGDTDSAAATLEIVRSVGKATGTSLVLLGDIYLNYRQPELAVELYTDALAKKDLDKTRIFRVARQLASTTAWKELDTYLADLEKNYAGSLTDAESIEVMNLKSQSALAQGENAEAANILAVVVEKDPLNGKALMLLADYYWKEKEMERAAIYFERAAKVSDVAADAMVQHARMMVAQKEFAKAARLLNEAQIIKPREYVGEYLAKVEAAARAAAF